MRLSSTSGLRVSLIPALVFLLLAAAAASAQWRREPPLQDYWPEGIQGAVSLTFDDGLPSQVVNAVPILNEHGLKGTFYVNAGPWSEWLMTQDLWPPVAADGHELGNHGHRHPCSCNHRFMPRELCLDNIGLQDIRNAMAVTAAWLDSLAPAQAGQRSWAYPCYESWVGRGSARESYVPVVSQTFVAGRAGMEMTNDPRWMDLAFTRSYEMHGQNAEQIIEMVERGVRRGHWVVLTFHGIGDDYIRTTTEDFSDVVQYLATEKERIWTGTFYDVASYVKENPAPTPTQRRSTE